ncbi:hypothetical protein [Gordonia bronchialis]|nr:hypothetical protein [Gordonia bronchialis]
MPLADARERAERVYYLRAVAGLSWRQIARETGYSSVGGAQRAYERHVARNELPNGQTTLAEILERKRFRQGVTTKGISTAMQRGDLSALASLLRASVADDTELAKLFGLNAPERHQVQAVVATTTTDLLDQLEAKFIDVIDGQVDQ